MDFGPKQRPSDAQYYMSHPDYKSKASKAFEEEWERLELGDEHQMATRVRVAARLLEQESDKVKEMIKEEAEQKHSLQLEKYRSAMVGEPATEASDIQRLVHTPSHYAHCFCLFCLQL